MFAFVQPNLLRSYLFVDEEAQGNGLFRSRLLLESDETVHGEWLRYRVLGFPMW